MRLIAWLGWTLVFFALFAFSLNNQQVVAVHFFFGLLWQAPLVVVVLAAFAAGAAIGILAMTPSLWRQWRRAGLSRSLPASSTANPVNTPLTAAPAPMARPADPTATDPHGI